MQLVGGGVMRKEGGEGLEGGGEGHFCQLTHARGLEVTCQICFARINIYIQNACEKRFLPCYQMHLVFGSNVVLKQFSI